MTFEMEIPEHVLFVSDQKRRREIQETVPIQSGAQSDYKSTWTLDKEISRMYVLLRSCFISTQKWRDVRELHASDRTSSPTEQSIEYPHGIPMKPNLISFLPQHNKNCSFLKPTRLFSDGVLWCFLRVLNEAVCVGGPAVFHYVLSFGIDIVYTADLSKVKGRQKDMEGNGRFYTRRAWFRSTVATLISQIFPYPIWPPIREGSETATFQNENKIALGLSLVSGQGWTSCRSEDVQFQMKALCGLFLVKLAFSLTILMTKDSECERQITLFMYFMEKEVSSVWPVWCGLKQRLEKSDSW